MRPGKIPVFRTVGAGISFLVVRFPGIVRAAIVPGLLAGASLFAMHWYVLPNLTQESAFGDATIRNPFLAVPFVLVYLFATIMFFVGVAKVYFREPIGLLYGGSRTDEWRLLGGTVGVVLFMFLVCGLPTLGLIWVAVTFLEFSTVAPPVTRHVNQVPLSLEQDSSLVLMLALGVIVLFCFYMFLAMRFSLLVPAAIKDGRFGMWRSWKLMRGNVWRMIIVTFLALFPLLLFLLPVLAGVFWLMTLVSEDEVTGIELNGTINIDSFTTVPGLIMLAGDALLYMLATALFIGMFSYAFQKLSEDEAASA